MLCAVSGRRTRSCYTCTGTTTIPRIGHSKNRISWLQRAEPISSAFNCRVRLGSPLGTVLLKEPVRTIILEKDHKTVIVSLKASRQQKPSCGTQRNTEKGKSHVP